MGEERGKRTPKLTFGAPSSPAIRPRLQSGSKLGQDLEQVGYDGRSLEPRLQGETAGALARVVGAELTLLGARREAGGLSRMMRVKS